MLQDKKSLRERCEALSEALERRQQEQARAARELKNSSSKCEGYRQQVSRLETGLERVSQSVSSGCTTRTCLWFMYSWCA